jgi:hypothetical protein
LHDGGTFASSRAGLDGEVVRHGQVLIVDVACGVSAQRGGGKTGGKQYLASEAENR